MSRLLVDAGPATPVRPEPASGDDLPRVPPRAAALATALCALATLLAWLVPVRPWSVALLVVAFVAGGTRAVGSALEELRAGRLGVDLLMVLAALGAAAVGDAIEGAVLLFLFSLSGTLEAYAMYRTTRSIDALIQLRPREAGRMRDGVEERVPVEELAVGDLVRVRPGERFPVDGRVVEGETWADEATLTGESEPIAKRPGSDVYAGTINGRGSVLIRMTRAVADTTLEKIVRMVREAQAEKTDTQRMIESWQQPYVLSVLGASAFVFGASWLLHGESRPVREAFYQAMVLLVVASPCAVVIGTPAVTLSGIARAARRGVLFKGGVHLEMLGVVDVVAFDKTGTITRGELRVTGVEAVGGLSREELLRLAAAVEARSEHPLAQAVVAEARRLGLELPEVREFDSHTGEGVHAHADGQWIGVGREALFRSHGVPIPPGLESLADDMRARGQTALLVVLGDGVRGGVIAVADEPRPEAAGAIAELKRYGVARTVILTGDHERVAQAVARAVGADEVCAGLLPDQKVIELRRLIKAGHRVAMVGDGVNDAPALATAQVGIAMGGAGTDVALEVADVVLMRDDLKALPFAVWLSRRARRKVRQNLTFAFGVIAVLVLSSFFNLPLYLGVVGHEGSTLLVVLNGLSLLWARESATG